MTIFLFQDPNLHLQGKCLDDTKRKSSNHLTIWEIDGGKSKKVERCLTNQKLEINKKNQNIFENESPIS